MLFKLLTSLSLLLFLLVSEAPAGLITLSFSGTIDVNTVPEIPFGSPFFGMVTYLTTGIPVGTGIPGFEVYLLPTAQDLFFVNIGGYTFSSFPGVMNGSVSDGPTTALPQIGYNDYFAFQLGELQGSISLPGYLFHGEFIQVVGNAGMLTGIGLPLSLDPSTVLPIINGIPTVVGVNLAEAGSEFSVEGTIMSIQISSVPEPASVLLVSIGSMLLFVFARLHARQQK